LKRHGWVRVNPALRHSADDLRPKKPQGGRLTAPALEVIYSR